MIKALSEPKPETKSEQTPKTKLKPEPKPKPKLRPEPKIEIKVNRNKLKTLKKDFDELRHKFSNKDEIREDRNYFYDNKNNRHIYDPNIKNYRHLSESEIQKVIKHINKLKTSLKSKSFQGNIDSVDYNDLDNYDNNYDFADDDDEYRKIGSIRTLFKEFDSDYYQLIRTDDGFAGRKNNYIEYKSKGDKYESLSPK